MQQAGKALQAESPPPPPMTCTTVPGPGGMSTSGRLYLHIVPEHPESLIVKDAKGQALANVLFRERAAAANVHEAAVVSTGQRNTCIESFCWGFNSQGFTWLFVELSHYLV